MSGENANGKVVEGVSTPLLRIDAVSKDFGYKVVLRSVTLDVRQGSATLLLGKNGAGKSTLIRIVSGLTRPCSGSVLFNGVNISRDPERYRRSIGVIFHSSQLYGDLTARENLLFFARLRNVNQREDRIENALERTGMTPFSDVAVRTFSSGMSKRLNIAVLMVIDPKILLLDEPYSGLDYKSVDFFNQYLGEFKQQGGAILIISHQITACFDYCDSVAILERGEIGARYRTTGISEEELVLKYRRD